MSKSEKIISLSTHLQKLHNQLNNAPKQKLSNPAYVSFLKREIEKTQNRISVLKS